MPRCESPTSGTSCRTATSSSPARRISCWTLKNSGRPISQSLETSPGCARKRVKPRGSEARPFEGLLGPAIVDGVDEAVPDPDRAPTLPRGFLIRLHDLPRPENLLLRRREYLVRETHLLGVHDLLSDVAEAFRFDGLGPEAVIVLEMEEHP